MYIFKNAITSIVRNKERNILIGIIILVISCAAAVTLAIRNSATSLITSYKDKYEVEATISVNREKMIGKFDPSDESSRSEMKEAFNSASDITVDDIKKYADSKFVKNYYYTMSLGMNGSNLEKITSEEKNNFSSGKGMPVGEDKENSTGDFTLIGYSTKDAMTDFIEGSFKISDGEVFNDFTSDSCIINKELADANNIKVGDKITLVNPDDDSKTYSLEVTGIFEDKSEDNKMNMFSNSANKIISNTAVLTKVRDNNEDLKLTIEPIFILKNSNLVNKFTKEVSNKGLSEYLTINTNLDQVESSTSAINNLSTFAITFLIIAIIIGVVVLLFINMINIRERKYEIGVLRTIGMKKQTVVLQFISELLIVSITSLFLGGVFGSIVSVPISNKLLDNEIKSNENKTFDINKNFGQESEKPREGMDNKKFRGVANVQKITSINAVVDLKVFLELLGIGLLITLISGISALISIERFSPLTILKERS